MRIILFASPGILGPYTLATLIHLKQDVRYLILPSSWHALPATELLQLAEGANIPVLTPQNLHDSDFVITLKQCMPDLMIVATFDKKIPSDVIQIPRLGAINIHSSFLPAYRGACPEFWVMRNGAQETGVSIHLLNEEFDKGDIIVQGKVPISPRDTVGVLLYRIASTSSKLLIQVLTECKKGNVLTGVSQNEQDASNAPLVKPPDFETKPTEPALPSFDSMMLSIVPAVLPILNAPA